MSERFKAFTYDEIVARDKANIDSVWLKDDSHQDAADFPPPKVLAQEIAKELESPAANSPHLINETNENSVPSERKRLKGGHDSGHLVSYLRNLSTDF